MYEKAHIGIYLEFQSSYSNKVEDEIKKQKQIKTTIQNLISWWVKKKKNLQNMYLKQEMVFFIL